MSCLTTTTLAPCDEDRLLNYLAKIQVLNPETIINLSTIDELPALCDRVEENLTDLDAYLRTCEPSQKDLYIKLLQGVDTLYNRICTKNSFADDFRNNYNCYHQISEALLKCNGPDDWNEGEDTKVICDYYKLIVECYFITTSKECGQEAANILKDLTVKVINSILVVQCDDMLAMFDPAPIYEAVPRKTSSGCSLQEHLNFNLLSSCVYLSNLFIAK